jgi:hypothetical protein
VSQNASEDVDKPNPSEGLAEEKDQASENPVPAQPTSTGLAARSGGQDENATARPPQAQVPSQGNRLDTLPTLASLSSDILKFLARLTPTEALGLSNTPNSPKTREYAGLRARFDPLRNLFNTGAPFLSARDLGLQKASDYEAIRKANQAIFMSSIFTGEIGLRDMDRSFLAVFVPENARLLKAQASIYLELKTQGFITAWRTGAAPPAVVMADLFGPDLDKNILARRPGTTSLAPSEQDFLNRLSSRREILQTHVKNNTLDQLPLKYRWEDFSREVSSYLSKNIENTASQAKDSADPSKHQPKRSLPRGQMEGQFSILAPPLPVTSTESILSPAPLAQSSPDLLALDDFVAQAARAAEIAMQDPSNLSYPEQFPNSSSPATPTAKPATPTPNPVLPDYQHYDPNSEKINPRSPASGTGNIAEIPHISQTAPTSVLYERARLAATTKASLIPRKGVIPTQRRTWTTEEENALMTGLDQAKGPHWSQILAMYGPGGTISEALKDRNQVQLKDKARNLKLFFLKSGIEVPYYLKHVTGDLRTRAPGLTPGQTLKRNNIQHHVRREADGASSDGLQSTMPVEGDVHASGTAEFSASPDEFSPDIDEAGQGGSPAESNMSFDISMSDVEAMIERAAAQATESIGRDWP